MATECSAASLLIVIGRKLTLPTGQIANCRSNSLRSLGLRREFRGTARRALRRLQNKASGGPISLVLSGSPTAVEPGSR